MEIAAQVSGGRRVFFMIVFGNPGAGSGIAPTQPPISSGIFHGFSVGKIKTVKGGVGQGQDYIRKKDPAEIFFPGSAFRFFPLPKSHGVVYSIVIIWQTSYLFMAAICPRIPGTG